MTKTVEITINDFNITRKMLGLSGFKVVSMTDDELLNTTLSLLDCYGVNCKVIEANTNIRELE